MRFLVKTDIFKRTMWFSYRSEPGVFIPLHVEAVHKILEANAAGESPDALIPAVKASAKLLAEGPNFENLVGQDSLTRFDRKGGKQRGGNLKRNPNKVAAMGQGDQRKANSRPKNAPRTEGTGEQVANNPNERRNKPQDQKPNPNQQRKPQNKQGTKPQARPEGRKENRGEDKEEGKPQNKPQENRQPRPQGKPERRPDNRPQNRPQNRPNDKPKNDQPQTPDKPSNDKKDEGQP